MSAEMSLSRLIAPYFGNSLYTWTNIVGIVMIALAIGAYLGGRLADKKADEKFYFSIVMFTGLWILFMPFFSTLIFEIIIALLPSGVSTIGSFIAILILIALPMVLMAMIVPYTLKLIAKDIKKIGTSVGIISAVSTTGSILGTFLPAFVLIPYIGTTKTFLVVGFLLFAVSAFGLRSFFLKIFSVLSLLLFFIVPPVYAAEDIIYSEDSPYHFIFIKEAEDGTRYLMLDHAFASHSVYNPKEYIVDNYFSYLATIPAFAKNPQSALVLGHAGGSITRLLNHFYPDIEVTGVEIDPNITDVAMEYMGIEDAKVAIVHEDARTFLIDSDKKYDLIFVDAYASIVLPVHLATKEFFELLETHLNDDGIVALNVLSFEQDLLNGMQNTIGAVFKNVVNIPVPGTNNTIVLASNNLDMNLNDPPAELINKARSIELGYDEYTYDSTANIFTDDKSNIEILSEKNAAAYYSRAISE